MAGKNQDLSIVILSYNTRDITNVCIEKAKLSAAFSKSHLGNNTKIIVVDNASTDGTVELIRGKHKNVKLIANKTNFGVSKGYNMGMKASKTPYILIINSDLYLEKDTVYNSLKYLKNNKKCDVLMCRLTPENKIFEKYGGHLPTPFRTALWLMGFESLPFSDLFLKKIYRYNDSFYQKDNVMEWAPTCFYFLRREVFEVTGGNDENLFLYMEDVEWSKRIKDYGFEIWFTPKFGAVHLCGESTDKKLPSTYIQNRQIEGIKYFHKKHYKSTYPVINALLTLGLGMRAMFYLLKANKLQSKAYINAFSTSIAS